jgi:3-hydroxyacyl-[acyl-carrier-protein] dehydratase
MKFRMVDRILDWSPRRVIRGTKTVSFEEYQLRGPLGDGPCLPESLLVECLFQLGNWLIVLSTDFAQMGMVTRFEEIRFAGRLGPGRRLTMEVEARSWRDDGIVLDGRATDGQQVIAAGRGCLALPVALADYCDADDLRVLFTEIHRPEGPQRVEATSCPA